MLSYTQHYFRWKETGVEEDHEGEKNAIKHMIVFHENK